MDVLSILRKKRQQLSGLRVDVEGQRVDQLPWCTTRLPLASG